MAPYCAILRDYLSYTPILRAMGFLVSQHGQLGAIPPPPFLSVSPLESMRSGGAKPPAQKGYLSDTCAIPYENKANGRLCDAISKGYCAIWGVSRTGPLRAPFSRLSPASKSLSSRPKLRGCKILWFVLRGGFGNQASQKEIARVKKRTLGLSSDLQLHIRGLFERHSHTFSHSLNMSSFTRGERTHPQDFSLTKKTARCTKGQFRPY